MLLDVTAEQVLAGHTDETTALVIDDYPYGFRLRCKIRYWIETHPKRGDRFCSQTNPKVAGEVWNKPKKSTYAAVAVMYLDAEGHVQWTDLGLWAPQEQITHFFNISHGKLTEQQDKALHAIVAYRKAYDAREKSDGFVAGSPA